MDQRKDRLTELFIDAALNTSSTHGVRVAASVLLEHGVSKRAIFRLLVEGRRRRAKRQRRNRLHWLFG